MLDIKRLKVIIEQEDNYLKLIIKLPIPCMREAGGFDYSQNIEYIEYSYLCISYVELNEILDNFKRRIKDEDYKYCEIDKNTIKGVIDENYKKLDR